MIIKRQKVYSSSEENKVSKAGVLGLGAGASLAGAAYEHSRGSNAYAKLDNLSSNLKLYNAGFSKFHHGIGSEAEAREIKKEISKLEEKVGKHVGRRNALLIGSGALATGAAISGVKAAIKKKKAKKEDK